MVVGIGGGVVVVAVVVTTLVVNPNPSIKKRETCQVIHDYRTQGKTIHANSDPYFST